MSLFEFLSRTIKSCVSISIDYDYDWMCAIITFSKAKVERSVRVPIECLKYDRAEEYIMKDVFKAFNEVSGINYNDVFLIGGV